MTRFLTDAEPALQQLIQRNPTLLYGAGVLIFCWITWRLFAFTLQPILHPLEPLELPYSIPILGHAMPFYKNSHAFLRRAQRMVGKNRDPFSFTAFGNKFYVIWQTQHAVQVDKNTDTLSFEEFIHDFLRSSGVSEPGIVSSQIDKLPPGSVDFPNPTDTSIGNLSRAMSTHQLQTPEMQRDLETRFLQSFDLDLRVERLDNICHGPLKRHISLYKWCADFFTRAGQFAFFGENLARLDPTFSDKFYVFDELSWQVTYKVPAIFAKEMNTAKEHLLQSLQRYFRLPDSQRADEAWLTTETNKGLTASRVTDYDKAVLFLTIYLTVNTNTRRTTFWMLTYILYNPSLIELVRNETAKAFKDGELVDPEYIYSHESCPQIQAIWLETLRMTSNGSSVRCVNKDTVIGGKLLRKGNKILMPFRLFHFDESVYSDETDVFRHERFLKAGNRTRGGGWRPFGGGKSLCTGRFVAEHAIKSCVAIVLRRFDLQLVGEKPLPKGDECTPGLGIMGLLTGEDFDVEVAPRAGF